ncbi:MAG: transposase [Candidatus Neptunochlamydia sp.]|nr:transposase [Candidatus Neptunochlamydia sp.]
MKKFDEEFKANAVRLVREERMKIKDVAHDLGIGKSTLTSWLGAHRRGEFIKTGSQKKEDVESIRSLEKWLLPLFNVLPGKKSSRIRVLREEIKSRQSQNMERFQRERV